MRTKKIKPSIKLLPAPSLLHSGLRIGALSIWLRLKRFSTPAHLLVLAAGTYLLLSSAFTASFFLPRSATFSFAQDNCFTSPTLLPNLISKKQGKTFTATPSKSLAIAGYPVYSHTTCITASQAPAEKTSESVAFNPLGIGFLKKNIHIVAGELPNVDYKAAFGAPISTKDPLVFSLDSADRVFDYQLLVNNKKLACNKNPDTIACDVAKLGLEQSASYTIVMQRLFDGKVHTALFEQTVATVGAVQLASSSIASGQTVYDAPTQMVITLNKEVRSFSGVELHLVSGETRQKIPITAVADGSTITVRFNEALTRSASFELTANTITAPDGGHLPTPLVLTFVTSGGPRVKGSSIGSYKVSTAGNIVITFDSNISATQALGEFIQLQINGNAIPAAVTASGNRVTINPSNDLPKCANFTVRALDGLQNEAGIAGGSAWQYKSRTICQTIFSIGTSVQGRGITGYRFGSGDSYVVFVGGTHGDEKSSTYTLNSFVDYLEAHYDQIPANRTIVIIPNLNPDGYAKTQRTNANNVDLNRNFPANNWKQGVSMPGGSFNPNGGGNAPLSEPESGSLADYILSVNPRLVLTYHAAAGVVMPNDSGDSVALAQTYDQKSNLNYEPSSQTGAIFTYDTTGSFEEWLYDKHNIPTLLVELWTKSSNEFTKNQNAMWHMATL